MRNMILVTLLSLLSLGIGATAPVRAALPSGESGLSTDTILARHLAWLGGAAALERLDATSVSGRLEVSGLSGSFRSVQTRSGLQHTEYDLGVVKGAQAVGRDSAWVMDGSGRVEPMGAEEEKTTRRAIARSFDSTLDGSDGSSRHDLGAEDKDGRSWRVVGFTYSDGDSYDLFLDPADGSLGWAREKRDTETIWHRFEDWRLVDGLRFAFAVSEIHTNPGSNQVLRIDEVEVNPEVAADLFAPPRAVPKLYAFSDDAQLTDWMPMKLFRGSYIWIQGSVNGTDTDMLLDSGAGMTVLDKSFAASLGVATSGEVVARGTVGESSASFAGGLTIGVGAFVLRDLHAAVLDLSGVAAKLGRPLPVILGKEAFHSVVVDVDYPGQRIRFIEPAAFRYEGPGHRLRVFPAEDGHTQIEISIEGLPPVQVGLDTGSGAALDLFGPYVNEHRLLEGRSRVSEALVGGVGGMATEKLISLKSVEIAGYSIRDVPSGIIQVETGAFATRRSAGNLGAGILKRFRVAFDYPHDCLWLEPNSDTESGPFVRNNSGLSLDRRNGVLEVVLVAPGSPAEAAGWKVGERIVSVNGSPVGGTFAEGIDLFSQGSEGTVVRLGMEDKSERRLTLGRYF
jgi:predicted aspartyl protease